MTTTRRRLAVMGMVSGCSDDLEMARRYIQWLSAPTFLVWFGVAYDIRLESLGEAHSFHYNEGVEAVLRIADEYVNFVENG